MSTALKNRGKRLERRPDLSPKPTIIDRIRAVMKDAHLDPEGFQAALERAIRGDGEWVSSRKCRIARPATRLSESVRPVQRPKTPVIGLWEDQ